MSNQACIMLMSLETKDTKWVIIDTSFQSFCLLISMLILYFPLMFFYLYLLLRDGDLHSLGLDFNIHLVFLCRIFAGSFSDIWVPVLMSSILLNFEFSFVIFNNLFYVLYTSGFLSFSLDVFFHHRLFLAYFHPAFFGQNHYLWLWVHTHHPFLPGVFLVSSNHLIGSISVNSIKPFAYIPCLIIHQYIFTYFLPILKTFSGKP